MGIIEVHGLGMLPDLNNHRFAVSLLRSFLKTLALFPMKMSASRLRNFLEKASCSGTMDIALGARKS